MMEIESCTYTHHLCLYVNVKTVLNKSVTTQLLYVFIFRQYLAN